MSWRIAMIPVILKTHHPLVRKVIQQFFVAAWTASFRSRTNPLATTTTARRLTCATLHIQNSTSSRVWAGATLTQRAPGHMAVSVVPARCSSKIGLLPWQPTCVLRKTTIMSTTKVSKNHRVRNDNPNCWPWLSSALVFHQQLSHQTTSDRATDEQTFPSTLDVLLHPNKCHMYKLAKFIDILILFNWQSWQATQSPRLPANGLDACWISIEWHIYAA